MKKLLLFFVGMGILSSCSESNEFDPHTMDMRIDHFQNTGVGEGLYLTLRVQQGDNIGSDEWTKFYGSIEGFTYQPGFIYDLRVTVQRVENPPADGSSTVYRLKETRSMQEVSSETPFEIELKTNGQNFVTKDTGYRLLGQIGIDCNSLCDELDAKLAGEDFVNGTFKRGQNGEIQLISVE